jgi:hypothetical protein
MSFGTILCSRSFCRDSSVSVLTSRPSKTTVTSVAMRLGVWDMEAMAGRYRHLFGERPVETLRSAGTRFKPLEDSRSAGVRTVV